MSNFRALLIVAVVVLVLWLYFRNKNLALKLDYALPWLNIQDSILDIGSGDGCTATKLRQLGYSHVQALDIVDKHKCGCDAPTLFDGTGIPFPSKSFDVTVCAYVLHHAPNQVSLLDEIRRVTRKYLLLFEDTPVTTADWLLAKKHSQSDWGPPCESCFHSYLDWVNFLETRGWRLVQHNLIGRSEFPFADKPFYYPQLRSFFCFTPSS